jgi:endonuclease/exonuclease/phosphatase family metal-dependent hydrolase
MLLLEQIELSSDQVPEAAPAEHPPRLVPQLALLVRTWNVFHGNAEPPERRTFLELMVRLVSADDPDVLLLQEVPVWALRRLARWSGMQLFGAVASRPKLGSAELGGAVTALHRGLFRSAFTGQANAILLGPRMQPLASDSIYLNPLGFRRAWARRLELDLPARLRWARERRVCQAVRAAVEGRSLVVANLHISSVPEIRLRDAELRRAAAFVDRFAEPGEPIVLGGDLNVRSGRSKTLQELSGPEWGFSVAIPGLDQILVRGAAAEQPEPWPEERRRVEGRLLSDHPPVQVRIE